MMAIFFSRPLTLTIISFGICVKPSPGCGVPRAPPRKAARRRPGLLIGRPASARAPLGARPLRPALLGETRFGRKGRETHGGAVAAVACACACARGATAARAAP